MGLGRLDEKTPVWSSIFRGDFRQCWLRSHGLCKLWQLALGHWGKTQKQKTSFEAAEGQAAGEISAAPQIRSLPAGKQLDWEMRGNVGSVHRREVLEELQALMQQRKGVEKMPQQPRRSCPSVSPRDCF